MNKNKSQFEKRSGVRASKVGVGNSTRNFSSNRNQFYVDLQKCGFTKQEVKTFQDLRKNSKSQNQALHEFIKNNKPRLCFNLIELKKQMRDWSLEKAIRHITKKPRKKYRLVRSDGEQGDQKNA